MKTPRCLSYSSLTLWEKNPEEFYLRLPGRTPGPAAAPRAADGRGFGL